MSKEILQIQDTSDRWRVLLPEQIAEAGPEAISDFADCVSISEYGTTSAELKPHVDEFDAIILRSAELDANLLAAADNLQVISKHGVGLDNVDIEFATERGIVVCNVAGANARSVGEMAFTHLLATRRNLIQADSAVRSGNWGDRADWDRFSRHTIEGTTLGLFGFGNTARETANIARGIGVDCVAYDPYVSDSEIPDAVTRVDDKAALFDAADAITVHAPLTGETAGAIGRPELRQIDYVVNVGRGGIIDERELVAALDANELIAAGLDVLENEPPHEDDPLLRRDDVVLSPHIGGQSVESTTKMSAEAAANVRSVYEGTVPDSAVNRPDLVSE